MNAVESPWMDDDLRTFRETVARFVEAEMVPHDARWRAQHHVDRETWLKAGETGLLLLDIPDQYGGGGGDFRHEAIFYEELSRRGLSGFGQGVHSIAAHYVLNHGNEAQRQRWLPRLARGELIGAIAMTEPGAGSDLQGIRTRAVRDGDHYVVNGSKIFITNGGSATLLMLVVRTDPADRKRGLSILMVETEGLRRLPRRPRARQDGHGGAGHRGAVLRGRARARRLPARRGGARHVPDDVRPALRARHHRALRRRRDGGRARRDLALRQGAQGVRPPDRQHAEHPLQARGSGDHHPHRARLHRRLHRRSCSRASSTPRPRRWRSTGSPTCSSRCSTSACRCTAATAT